MPIGVLSSYLRNRLSEIIKNISLKRFFFPIFVVSLRYNLKCINKHLKTTITNYEAIYG